MSIKVVRPSLTDNFRASAHIGLACTTEAALAELAGSLYAASVLGLHQSPTGIEVTIDLGTPELDKAAQRSAAFELWAFTVADTHFQTRLENKEPALAHLADR